MCLDAILISTIGFAVVMSIWGLTEIDVLTRIKVNAITIAAWAIVLLEVVLNIIFPAI